MTMTLFEISKDRNREQTHSPVPELLETRREENCSLDLADGQRTRSLSGFELREVDLHAGRTFEDAHHGNALLLCEIDGRERTSASHALCYLPPGAPLRNAFETGTRYLVAGIPPETLKRAGVSSKLDRPARICGFAAEWLGRRLVSEFYRDDPLSRIALEGILLQLLVELGRGFGTTASVRTAPQWLRAAREYVRSNCLRNLRLAEIATAVGVHRVHLAREFRRHYSVTVGEFITRRRLEEACRLLAETEDPLADIAVACGYSDQSHFGAIFRRNVGLTPARFRNIAHPQ